MSDAKYGERGRIYSRKGRYHKNYPKKEPNKSQFYKKPEIRQPVANKTILSDFESIEYPALATIKAKRVIDWQNLLTNAILICMSLVFGGLILSLLWR